MYRIENLTQDAKQKQTLVLPDGTQIVLSIYFISQQLGWFITELVYGDFVLNGVRITNSPNILYQFRNQIPFGLACISANNQEPLQQQVFEDQSSNLYVLTEAEVNLYTDFLTGVT